MDEKIVGSEPIRPVGQRSRGGRRPATSRAQLEEVAFRLFAERGFDQTSVDDIAAAAGVSRRTFFHYYPSKNDVVWGDFGAELARMRAWLAGVAPAVPMMEAVHRAVVEFNRIDVTQEAQHRRRLGLILGVPTLLANSTLRFVQWREVIAEFAARRLGVAADDLLPSVIAYSALGASLAAYEVWLRDESAGLVEVLDQALGQLAIGFRHHGRDDDPTP